MQNHKLAMHIKKLNEEREHLLLELATLRKEFRSEVDPDIGAGDPKLAERDRVMALIRFKQRQLNTVEKALEDARKGLYGICERCKNPIDPARLEALPGATLCLACKRVIEWQKRLRKDY